MPLAILRLRARFKIPERGCVVLDQPQRASIFLRLSLVLRAAADLRYSRAPFLKQALSRLNEVESTFNLGLKRIASRSWIPEE